MVIKNLIILEETSKSNEKHLRLGTGNKWLTTCVLVIKHQNQKPKHRKQIHKYLRVYEVAA